MATQAGVRFLVALALPLLVAAGRPVPQSPERRDAAADPALRLAAMLDRGELSLARVQPDPVFAGRRHLRYDQRLGGVRVFGRQLVQQLDADGRTLSVFGRVEEPTRPPEVVPAISADAAARAALAVFPAGGQVLGEPELVLLPRQGRLLLAWTAHVRYDQRLERVFVDAKTGAIAHHYSDLHGEAAAGIGRGVWGDRKKISVDSQSGTYHARDRLRPPELVTYDMRDDLGTTLWLMRTGMFDASYVASDSDNDWTDGAVVDAHVYAGLTYDYFYTRHGRRGLDGNDMPITSVTHFFPGYANAFWDPGVSAMFYGDGDGETAAFSGALDVVAHELTHGVTEYTWGAIYEDESGALDEAFSDMMSTGAEFMHQPAGNGRLMADYFLGEDLAYDFNPPRTAIRSMENPGLFCSSSMGCNPDHYSRLYRGPVDGGGVHHNSGIANQAFYLLAEGGVNRTSGRRVAGLGPSGREKAERIFYRGFTSYLTPSATFHDARLATLRAARDLYGEAEAAQVAATWSAVGVE